MKECCTVITGAASGIGYAVASKLLSQGESIAAVDLNSERLQDRFHDNANVCQISCDLTTADGFHVLTTEIKRRFPAGVKGFVHAAGVDIVAPIGMVSAEAMQKLYSIHTVFPVLFLGWLSRKANHVPEAAGVLISSLSTHEGAKGHVAYAAAKGGVEGALRPAAAELVGKGIRINAVILGVVETEMSQAWLKKLTPEQFAALKDDYPLGLGKPEAVADVIAFLLSPSAKWIAGQTIVCDGGHGLV